MMNAPYQNVAKGLASLGRFEDDYIIHAAEGETVIPAEVLQANPDLKASLFKQMRAMGIDQPERYVVGDKLNSINPETGQPEFFFKSIGKLLKKAAPIIGTIVGSQFGPIGAAIGGGLGSLAGGASPEQALINAGLSFAGAKFIGPGLDKVLGPTSTGIVGPGTAGTLGSILPEGIASALPASLGSMGVGTAAALALAPAAGGMISDALKPEEVPEPDRRSIVDEYYAALARGENPPLPDELTPPPQDSLFALQKQQPLPPIDEILIDPLNRPMFARAAYGGYVQGPGGPRDDKIPTLLSNTEYVQTGKAVAGADPTGKNNPDRGAKVMEGIMRAFEKRADKNATAMA